MDKFHTSMTLVLGHRRAARLDVLATRLSDSLMTRHGLVNAILDEALDARGVPAPAPHRTTLPSATPANG